LKKSALLLLGFLALVSWLTAQPINIDKWLDQHKPIMQYRHLNRGEWVSEQDYFNSLNRSQKLRYIQMFWEIRSQVPIPSTSKEEDSKVTLEQEYQNRIEYVIENFEESHKSSWEGDRGKTVLLLGIPKVTGLTESQFVSCTMTWNDSDIGKVHLRFTRALKGIERAVNALAESPLAQQIRRGTSAEELGPDFRRINDNDEKASAFERKCGASWAPTDEGWKLWAETLKKK